MAVGIVDLLEKIDIRDGDAELTVGFVVQELFDLIQQRAAVGQAGEGIGARFPVQLLVVDGQRALAGLYAGTEKYAIHRQDQQRHNAVENLKDEVVGVVQRFDGGMAQRPGEQQYPKGHQSKGIDELAHGRLVDVEEDQRQYGHEYIRASARPTEAMDEPGQPRTDDRGKAYQVDPRVHAVDVQNANNGSGQDYDGWPKPCAGREKQEHHARQEIGGEYDFADEQRLSVICGHRAA